MPLTQFETDQKFALLASDGHAYIAGIANWYTDSKTIKRVNLSIPAHYDTAVFTSDTYSIKSDHPITDWATADNLPYIYAIVGSTNELVVIDKRDMREVQKQFVGSNPAVIKIYNNKAYIIFKGENHINIIDLQDGLPSKSAISKITTKHYPLNVFPDRTNRILYDAGRSEYGISVTSDVYTSVSDAVYYEKNAGVRTYESYILDADNELFYGADNYNLSMYDSQTFKLKQSNDINGGYYEPTLHLDEDSIYFGSGRYDANNPSILYGKYPERIIYARGDLVFSHGSVYDKDSFAKLSDLYMFIKKPIRMQPVPFLYQRIVVCISSTAWMNYKQP